MKNQRLTILTILSLCLGFLIACSSSGGGSSDSDNMTVAEDNQTSADNTTTDMGGSGVPNDNTTTDMGGSGVPNDNTTSAGDSGTGGSSDTINLTGPIADLQGTWVTACFPPGYSFDSSFYRQLTVVFSEKTITYTENNYEDASCENSVARKQGYYSNVVLADNITLSDGTTGHQFSVKWEEFTAVPYTSTFTQILNDISQCGISTWVTNQEFDIMGKDCSATDRLYPPKNATAFNLFKLTGNNLYFGTYSTDGYPSSINTIELYVKQ